MNNILLIILSLSSSVIIAIVGFVPSIFITIFNVNYFGITYGFLLSLVGESLGAVVAFYLYRLGFKKISTKLLSKYKLTNKTLTNNTVTQVKLILAFRLFPYMPSGLVTFMAAISNINIILFTITSTIGKIPAMILEVLFAAGIISVAKYKNIDFIILIISAVLILAFCINIFKKGKNE